jgi:hypothetical protein
MADRQVLTYEDPSGIGDRIEIIVHAGGVYFMIESDWAGDTERGFGESCSITIPQKKAIEFLSQLTKALTNKE